MFLALPILEDGTSRTCLTYLWLTRRYDLSDKTWKKTQQGHTSSQSVLIKVNSLRLMCVELIANLGVLHTKKAYCEVLHIHLYSIKLFNYSN